MAEAPSINQLLKPLEEEKNVTSVTDAYLEYYNDRKQDHPDQLAPGEAAVLTNKYYDIATDFFEWGWGECFHFGHMNKGESRDASILRHEHNLAMKLGLKEGDEVLDIGCGVGGPARHIATYSNAKVTGLNINDYQIERARKITEKAGLTNLCQFVKGDFCNIPYADNSLSRVYSIEATCHASDDLSRVYGDVFRVLKPGGVFAFYEWAMTDKYDPNNEEHQKTKDDILIGDGLPDLVSTDEVKSQLEKVGFELVESDDMALSSPVPWYSTLESNYKDFKSTKLGRMMTSGMLYVMETLKMAPKGSCKVHTTLCKGADGLAKGGRLGIFTPMFLLVAKKPS